MIDIASIVLGAAGTTASPDTFGDWVRTVVAGLIGALIGGLFTLWGQARGAKAQRDAQSEQLREAQRAADDEWTRSRLATARATSMADARKLYEEFTTLRQTIVDTPQKKLEMSGAQPWDYRWDEIWNNASPDIRFLGRLLVDDDTRSVVLHLIDLLDRAETLTAGYNPERIKRSLKDLVIELSQEGIEVMSSYIRDSEPEVHKELLESLDQAYKDYGAYEEWTLKNALEFAERFTLEDPNDTASPYVERDPNESEPN